MRRVLPLFCLLVLAVWLPATEHCALEASGALPKSCSDNCASGQTDGDDGCAAVENGAYKLSNDSLKIPVPDLFACACFLCLQSISIDVAREIAPTSGASFERPQDWI